MDILRYVLYAVASFAVLAVIVQWIRLELFIRRNNRAEIKTSLAVAQSKDPNPGYAPQGRSSSSVYYITFLTEEGEQVRLYMQYQDFYVIAQGSRGTLTWQGEKFLKFLPDNH